MWPIVPLSVRLPELQRHYSPAALGSFRRPLKVGCADRQLLLAARYKADFSTESRKPHYKILSESLATQGLEAAFALCHYP